MRLLLLLPSYPVESIGSRSASLENGVFPPPPFFIGRVMEGSWVISSCGTRRRRRSGLGDGKKRVEIDSRFFGPAISDLSELTTRARRPWRVQKGGGNFEMSQFLEPFIF